MTELKASKDFFHALSTTDELTGVANRRHFLDLAGAEIKRAARLRHPVSIALIDVDEFKEINDTHGHAAGDAALQTLARTFEQHIREIDLFARFGGDEFALLLPEADVRVAREAAERVRRSLETLKMDLDGSQASITISIGVSGLEPDDGSVDTLLARADRALYRAKRTGGNRTEVESSAPAGPVRERRGAASATPPGTDPA